MQIGKSNHNYGKRGMRNVSSITNVIRNINFDPASFTVRANGGGLFVWAKPGAAGDVASNWAFGVTLGANDSDPPEPIVTIEEGDVLVQGLARYTITKTDYVLPANPVADDLCIPTVSFVIATKVASIKLLTAEPVMTADEILIPLVKLKAIGSSTPYWDFDEFGFILHRGDVTLSTDLVFG
jgi:hypothetical protein